MTQTAPVLGHEQALYITESESKTNNSAKDSISHTKQNFHFISFESRLYKVRSTFLYRRRARFGLAIGEEFKQHFILIKGLIEFYRPKEIKFTFHKPESVFEVDLDVEKFTELDKLLVNVDSWLRQELQFKATLKKVIALEARHKIEAAGVYNILRGTLATQLK